MANIANLIADSSGNGKARIADVARLADVSPATVSRVLNHPDKVREVLRQKVQQAISALAYAPDNAARSLISRRTRTMAVVVPTLATSIFAEGIEALQSRLSELNYTLLIAASQYDPHRELHEVRTLIDRGVDGMVLVGNSHLPETCETIVRSGTPVLTTYVCESQQGVPAIGIDNESATYDMARYLLRLGHREFGVVANTQLASDRTKARIAGVSRALREAGHALEASRVVNCAHSISQGREGLRELLLAAPVITAVICTTDTLAVGALAEARTMGLRVPHDISVTGFDDIELAAQLEPPLTTIATPAREIGRSAADYLVSAVEGVPIPLNTALPYRLVARSSTARPRTRTLPRARGPK
ncbi:LacI family DNA-binding transcriptional regulator [Paraburkholderia sp. EG287A]|uniref:LacI family DNA-binding transcriptional regulator n=1 Tax=unclassified Paraburkholderia TaxID=2615204 RepID=UPI0034D2C499